MTTTTPSQLPVPHAPERPRRKRRWLRWTNDVTGTVTIADSQAVTAHLRFGLLALTSGDAKPAPQFGISLETQQ